MYVELTLKLLKSHLQEHDSNFQNFLENKLRIEIYDQAKQKLVLLPLEKLTYY